MSSSSSSQSSSNGWWAAITGNGSQSTSTYSSGSSDTSGDVTVTKDKKKLATIIAGATFFAGSCLLVYRATQHPLFRAWKQGWKKYYSLSESERAEILRDLRKHQNPSTSESSSIPSSSSAASSSSNSNPVSDSSNSDEVTVLVERISQYLAPSSKQPTLILFSLESLLIESSDAWYQLFSHAAMELFGLDDIGVETDEFRTQWWREGLQVTYERLKSKAETRATSSNAPSLPYELFQAYATYHFADFLPFLRLNPHAEPLLKTAKSSHGTSLALVTNMDRNILQLIFDMFPQLGSYFQLVDSASKSNVFCAGDTAPFPSPALLSTAVAAMSPRFSASNCSQCLFLASSSFEVEAASQTDCFTISVQGGSSSPSDKLVCVQDESALTAVLAALAAK